MADQETGHGPAASEPTGELLRQLSDQMSRLVRQEIELAKAEVTDKGKRAGIGVGMFGGAGVVGFYTVGTLLATIIAALSLALATWLAALIVTVVLGAVAAVLALQGRSKVQEAMPPVPERSVQSVKQDVEVTKNRAQSGRSSQ
ncbi:MAG: phage holin family protein [Solirubrobacteraceae bacterium]